MEHRDALQIPAAAALVVNADRCEWSRFDALADWNQALDAAIAHYATFICGPCADIRLQVEGFAEFDERDGGDNVELKQSRLVAAIGVSDVGAEGLGFAVPVDMVQRLSEDLITDGRVKHAYLGIGVDDAMIDLGDGAEIPAGAAITGFASGSAIQLAGADVGDVIIELNGISVNTKFDLLSLLRSYRAGDRIDILVTRSEEEVSFTVELGLRPDDL